MRVVRVTADLTVPDLAEATAFYTEFLGLELEDMGLDWVTRVVAPGHRRAHPVAPAGCDGPGESAAHDQGR